MPSASQNHPTKKLRFLEDAFVLKSYIRLTVKHYSQPSNSSTFSLVIFGICIVAEVLLSTSSIYSD
jgi:hypothetical protein